MNNYFIIIAQLFMVFCPEKPTMLYLKCIDSHLFCVDIFIESLLINFNMVNKSMVIYHGNFLIYHETANNLNNHMQR